MPHLTLGRICTAGVAFFSPFDTVKSAYRVVARLTAHGDWDGVDNGALYREGAWEAARLGANAIIADSLTESTSGGRLIEMATGWKQQRVAWATAIDIPADSQRVRLACGAKKSRGPPRVGGQ